MGNGNLRLVLLVKIRTIVFDSINKVSDACYKISK